MPARAGEKAFVRKEQDISAMALQKNMFVRPYPQNDLPVAICIRFSYSLFSQETRLSNPRLLVGLDVVSSSVRLFRVGTSGRWCCMESCAEPAERGLGLPCEPQRCHGRGTEQHGHWGWVGGWMILVVLSNLDDCVILFCDSCVLGNQSFASWREAALPVCALQPQQ